MLGLGGIAAAVALTVGAPLLTAAAVIAIPQSVGMIFAGTKL